MLKRVCDRCRLNEGKQIFAVTGRERDAGGSMADAGVGFDICTACALDFLSYAFGDSRAVPFEDTCIVGKVLYSFMNKKK